MACLHNLRLQRPPAACTYSRITLFSCTQCLPGGSWPWDDPSLARQQIQTKGPIPPQPRTSMPFIAIPSEACSPGSPSKCCGILQNVPEVSDEWTKASLGALGNKSGENKGPFLKQLIVLFYMRFLPLPALKRIFSAELVLSRLTLRCLTSKTSWEKLEC